MESSIITRPEKTKVWRINEFNEPLVFTTHFHAWFPRTPSSFSSVNNNNNNNNNNNRNAKDESALLFDVEELLQKYHQKYTYADILARNFPKAIDTSCLEVRFYLFFINEQITNCNLKGIYGR